MSKKIYFNYDNAGWEDVSSYIMPDFVVTSRAATDEYGYAQNVLSCTMNSYTPTGSSNLARLRAATEVKVKVVLDSTQIFQGIISNKSGIDYNGRPDTVQISLDATDSLKKLDKNIGDVVYWDCKILDPSSPATSLTHLLVSGLGLTVSSEVPILDTLSVFAPPSETDKVISVLGQLLYDFGYVLHMNEYDEVEPILWATSTLSGLRSLTDTDIVKSLDIKEDEVDYNGVKLLYNEIATKSGILLYQDDLPFDNVDGFTGYMVPSGMFYPLARNVIDEATGTYTQVYQEYSDNGITALTNKAIAQNLDYDIRTAQKAFKSDFSAIVATSGWSLDTRVSGLTLGSGLYYGNKKAQIFWQAASGLNGMIYYFNIYGTVFYKTADKYLTMLSVVSGEKIEDYASKYITSSGNAALIAQSRSNANYFGKTKYTFTHTENFAEGSFFHITTDDGTDADIQIIERKYENTSELYTYTARRYVADVTISGAQYVVNPSVPNVNPVYNASLSTYSVAVPSDNDGANPNLSNATVRGFVTLNNADDTSSWSCEITVSGGITYTFDDSTKQLQLDTMTTDTAAATFTFSRSGRGSLIRTATFSKQKQGTQGYTLVPTITSGIYSVTWDALGENPSPAVVSPAFVGNLSIDGVDVSDAASYSWVAYGNLSGTGTGRTFTPTIPSSIGSSVSSTGVLCTITYSGVATEGVSYITNVSRSIGTATSPVGIDWVADWDGSKVQTTTVSGHPYILAGGVYAGSTEADPLNPGYYRVKEGVFLGQGTVSGITGVYTGLLAIVNGERRFSLDAITGDAYFQGGVVATSGLIGSFNIGTYLYSGNKTTFDDGLPGVHLGSDGIGLGEFFTVSSGGVVTAERITALLQSCSIGGITAGDIPIKQDTVEETFDTPEGGGGDFIKSLQIAAAGTVRVVFSAAKTSTATALAMIYVNDVGVGTSRTLTTSYQTWSEDISITTGDIIRIYVFSAHALTNVRVKDFYVKSAETPGILSYLGIANDTGVIIASPSISITQDDSSNATRYPLFASAYSGSSTLHADSLFTYNPASGLLTASGFSGYLTGNASTATALQNARTIAISGGALGAATSFNGTANITIPVSGLNATYLYGTIPSAVLGASTLYVGTTAISLNRASASQSLTGITSIDGSAAKWTTARTVSISGAVIGTATSFDGSANFTIPASALAASFLSGTIPSAVLGASTLYVGTTAIALNRGSGAQALTGITSIDGSAATLTTARSIAISGGALGTATSFNGSANITIPVSGLNSTYLYGTIPTAVLGASTLYIGTTAIALNRGSSAQSLTGITSIDGSAATLTTARNISISGAVTGTATAFNGSANITIPASSLAASFLTGTIPSAVLGVSTLYVGTTAIALNRASASMALTGITSIDGSAAKWTTARTVSISGAVTGTATSLDGSANITLPASALAASFLSGTIPSAVLGASTLYVGTTAIALNRASASMALTGITSIDGSAATLTTARTISISGGVTGTATSFNGSANITLPVSSVAASFLSGTIPSAVLGASTLYVGTTAIALNRASASMALTGITSIDGSAATLTTARTIATSGGATGTATSFNGSANITIPISALDATFLTGYIAAARFATDGSITYSINPTIPATGVLRTNLGSPTIGELTLIPEEATNKLQFHPIAKFVPEYTADGVTWSGWGLSDATEKGMLLGREGGVSATITNGWVAARFTFEAQSYCFLNYLYMYTSTNGHTMKWKVEKSYDGSTWENVVADSGSGSSWPGHMFLPHGTIPWHPTPTLGSHYKYVRVTMTPTWNGSYPANGITIYNISWFGGYPSAKREIYTWDYDKNVTFPAGVTASTFTGALSGNASTATKLATARNISISGAVTGTATLFDGSADITLPASALAAAFLSGTIPSAVLGASTLYVGTTAIALNRASSSMALTGITSIDGSAAKWTTARTVSISGAVTGTATSLDGSANITLPASALAASFLSGTIPSAVLGNSTVYIGSTAVALNRGTGSLALTGITSIDGSAAKWTTARTVSISGAVTGTATSLDGSANITLPASALAAAFLSGTIPSAVLGASTLYVGTTAIALNRASASMALTGITSIDGSAAKWTTARTVSISGAVTGTATSLDGSANITLPASALAASFLSGTIPPAVLGNSTVYIGSTAIALNRGTGSLALTGITSIDGSAAKWTTARTVSISGGATGTATSLDGSANITLPVSSLAASFLSGTIPSAVLGASSVYIGTTAVALNRASAALALAGITSTESNYVSGNLGTGYKIDYGTIVASKSYMEVDNILVRDTLRTHLFEKDVIRIIGGQVYVSESIVIADDYVGSNTIYADAAKSTTLVSGMRMVIKEIIMASGTTIANIGFDVTAVGALSGGKQAYTVVAVSGYDALTSIKAGMVAARISGGTVLIDATSANSPFIDVKNNYVTEVRLGNLAGISSATFGTLSGYGLWSDNVYLEGAINATSGYVAGWTITSTSIRTGHARLYASGVISLGSADGYNTVNSIYMNGPAVAVSFGQALTFSGGVLTINGGGSFSGSLSAATGTFSGNLVSASGLFGDVRLNSSGLTSSGGNGYSLTTSGLTATKGTIGGWTVGTTAISNSNINISSATVSATAGDIVLSGGDAKVYVGSAITLNGTTSGSIYIGTGTYANTNTAFYVDGSGRMSLKTNLTWDGGTLTVSGTIYATAGTFAGSLSAATGTFAGSLSAATGTFAGSLSAATGTFSGYLTSASGLFGDVKLDSTGLTSNGSNGYSLNTSGITATKGLIGNWTIGATSISNANINISSATASATAGDIVLSGGDAKVYVGSAITLNGVASGIIYVGTGNYNNADTGFYVDGAGRMSLKQNFVWTGTTLTVSGAVYATSGSFAGSLAAATGTFAGSLSAATGTFAGSLSAATGTFAGNLSAAGGTFSGMLSAATGSFSGSLSAATGTFAGSLSAATGTFAGSLSAATGTFSGNLSAAGGTFSGLLSAATGTFAGSLSAATGTFSGYLTSASGLFGDVKLDSSGLTSNGAHGYSLGITGLTVTSGLIGGWAIGATSISNANINISSDTASATAGDIVLSGGNAKVYVGSKITLNGTTSGSIYIVTGMGSPDGVYNDTNTAFYVDGSGRMSLKKNLTWDGSVLTVSGAVYATTGVFSGYLTSASGLFGDVKLDASGISSNSSVGYSLGIGGLVATSGTIGGWKLSAAGITNATGNIALLDDNPGTDFYEGVFFANNAAGLTASPAVDSVASRLAYDNTRTAITLETRRVTTSGSWVSDRYSTLYSRTESTYSAFSVAASFNAAVQAQIQVVADNSAAKGSVNLIAKGISDVYAVWTVYSGANVGYFFPQTSSGTVSADLGMAAYRWRKLYLTEDVVAASGYFTGTMYAGIVTGANIRIPTAAPGSLSNGDIWVV